MSGYLEIKYPFKSNLGLNPFKSWKRQWCILRPSPTYTGASLAVYCSEAGAAAGSVDLPCGSVVKRAKSRTRPYAFAVFSVSDPRKPRILLAAQSLNDTQVWMEKIRAIINGSKILDSEPLLKDSYSVSVVSTELSRKCGLSNDTVVTLSPGGVVVARAQLAAFLEWKHITDVQLTGDDRNKTCVVLVDSVFQKGGGELKFTSPVVEQLAHALHLALDSRPSRPSRHSLSKHKLSKSDGDLRTAKCSDADMGDVRRSSWYSGPSEVSLDDIDLVMSKESKHIPTGQLSRCAGAGQLTGQISALTQPFNMHSVTSFDDSVSDRRSLLSVASGIYEEIPDLPEGAATTPLCDIGCDVPDGVLKVLEEPTYESVADCVYATLRRRRPPPLPPRHPFGASTLKANAWARDANVTRHSSLGSLPRCCPPRAPPANTLPKLDKRQPFSVFRKRLKSDSRITGSQKSETSKENKDVEPKKKKFDFTPTRDIFKSFKVSRKMKNLKITSGTLAKGETKSCEFLDDTEPVQTNRCSKSVECLENDFNFEADLSIEFTESIAALSLPQQIVELLLGHENTVRLKDETESDYMPMSPIIPPPIEHHYIVMSPRTNIA